MVRLFKWLVLFLLVLLPATVIAVANRHSVPLKLDPFSSDNPAMIIEYPLFLYLFAALLIGIVLGWMTTWVSQGQLRRRMRQTAAEANEWRHQASRLRQQLANAERAELPSP